MGLFDVLLPQCCVICRADAASLCARCRRRIVRVRPPLCERCGAPTAWPVARCGECAGRRLAFTHARAAAIYGDDVRRLVLAWKEHGLRRLAAEAATLVEETVRRPAVDAMTFVPADGDRRLRRGHHPAQRLGVELGRRWRLPVVPVLERRAAARSQRGLSLAERRRNVAGAFAAARTSPRRVVLVDDVYTSGATANAAAAALRRAGAKDLHVVTFARAVR